MMSALVVAAAITALPLVDHDPSLSAQAVCGMPTGAALAGIHARDSANGLLLSYDGIVLTWDENTETYSLSLGGNAVTDLVTYVDGDGWFAFAGLWSETEEYPEVFGRVDYPSEATWMVEITRPGHKPEQYDVEADGNNAIVMKARICDCKDGIGLTCKSTDCDNAVSCSADTSTCVWKNAAVVGN